ncbi:hypothetical protein QGM71_05290 [Virgibacillus sp. C22-A2]|uniref:DUF4046 domain-containing protein n=1 Tax=Virgibacillus tibetensis TaxID=3042313 RepID=A0ABU6KES0_9BACI|nr:hypothetical protein [Virgibacillus sp. C22-A2]
MNNYRSMSHRRLLNEPIIAVYDDLFTGARKGLPKGTWQNDKNVIIISRYVLEMKMGLSREEIPRINRLFIKEQKLWGVLNRFKSIKKLLNFVYPGTYDEFDFPRVSEDYWASKENIKKRLEVILKQNKLSLNEIPNVVSYDKLVEWGFSNPLKRHNDSPYQLMNSIYPNRYKPFQFKKVPQRWSKDLIMLRTHFLEMLQKEKISFYEVPEKVNQEMLLKYRFSGAMSKCNNSPSKFIMTLFPHDFNQEDFPKTQGYWHDIHIARNTILKLIKKNAIPYTQIPRHITKQLLIENGLSGLLDKYAGSPINIIQTCFPNEFDITEFKRVPNRYWYHKENRIKALRLFCKKNNIEKQSLPTLSRAYFCQHFPRFVSVLDRHYESKSHLWIIEAFPEHKLKASDFNLLIGDDGQACDSKEELWLHNFLVRNLTQAVILREGKRFVNKPINEAYIPDWVIQLNGKKVIVEYFGLYGSSRFPNYTERADRKITFYKTLIDYKFVGVKPMDLKNTDEIINKIANDDIIIKP